MEDPMNTGTDPLSPEQRESFDYYRQCANRRDLEVELSEDGTTIKWRDKNGNHLFDDGVVLEHEMNA